MRSNCNFRILFDCNYMITLIQSQRKVPPYPQQGSLKEAPKPDWGPLLGHVDTPEQNSPTIDFTHFTFQHSYLSNTSMKLIFPRPIALLSKSTIAKCIVDSFVVSICLGKLELCRHCRIHVDCKHFKYSLARNYSGKFM